MRKEPDVTLERILSLIPKKPDGKYVHGEKKKFAESIGYDSGDIVSMWINGSSSSYKGKIHEISMKYGVSVDWLEGKTDIKEPTGQGESEELTLEQIYKQMEQMSLTQLNEMLVYCAEISRRKLKDDAKS